MHHRRVRALLLLILLAAAPGGAQDLPDPGRRLSKEEQEADPDKPRPAAKAPDARPSRAHDARARQLPALVRRTELAALAQHGLRGGLRGLPAELSLRRCHERDRRGWRRA